jgi:predicted acylesterase/phospholipase RssA
MAQEGSLPGFDDRTQPDRYCDLVLTGGVTSAVAYPGVIHGLAQVYRLNAIGGSSSGAGSAALAAAAEYRRRHGSSEGFRTLLRRTADLKETVDGQTGLAWLFQPDPWSRRLFDALLPAFVSPTGRLGKFFAGVAAAYHVVFFAAFLFVVALVLGLAGWRRGGDMAGWVVAALLLALGAGLLATVRAIWRDIRLAADADYGLCSGQQRESDGAPQPLTQWLHELLQDIAGLPLDQPLTFADLHGAPGGPSETLADASPAGALSIDLRMFSADITQGRPLLLPLGQDDPPLYFRPREMRRLFPAEVVDAMMRDLGAWQRGSAAAAIEPRRAMRRSPASDPREDDLWALPRAGLPLLVAARMSVSFPVLFSAVPLWQRTEYGQQFRRLLFADGGLCSNFPIHLFDSPIPAWPTFGVSLYDGGGRYSLHPACIAHRVRVPQDHREQRADRASGFDQESKPLDRLLGFVGAIFTTTKDWNDALLSELPGVRERVAEVALPDNIGGLNIRMDAEQIECLARLGGEVARQLLARYAVPDGSGRAAPGWREHRWVRFNVLRECLQQTLLGLSRAAQYARHAEPLREQIRQACDAPPLAGAGESSLQPAQAAALERTLDALLQIERAFSPQPLDQPYRPEPRPELRIRPPL